MTALRDPRPMGTFDPSTAAYLHESLNDHVVVWNPECADDWHKTATPHDEGVDWNGCIFDAWGTQITVGSPVSLS